VGFGLMSLMIKGSCSCLRLKD